MARTFTSVIAVLLLVTTLITVGAAPVTHGTSSVPNNGTNSEWSRLFRALIRFDAGGGTTHGPARQPWPQRLNKWLESDDSVTLIGVAEFLTGYTPTFTVPGVCAVDFWSVVYLVAAAQFQRMNLQPMMLVVVLMALLQFTIGGCLTTWTDVTPFIGAALMAQPFFAVASHKDSTVIQTLLSMISTVLLAYARHMMASANVVSLVLSGVGPISLIMVFTMVNFGVRLGPFWYVVTGANFVLALASDANMTALGELLVSQANMGAFSVCAKRGSPLACVMAIVFKAVTLNFSKQIETVTDSETATVIAIAMSTLVFVTGTILVLALLVRGAARVSGATYTSLFIGASRAYMRGLYYTYAVLTGGNFIGRHVAEGAISIAGTLIVCSALWRFSILVLAVLTSVACAFAFVDPEFYVVKEGPKAKPSDKVKDKAADAAKILAQGKGAGPSKPAPPTYAAATSGAAGTSSAPAVAEERIPRSKLVFKDVCFPFAGGYGVRTSAKNVMITAHQPIEVGGTIDGRKAKRVMPLTQNSDLVLVVTDTPVGEGKFAPFSARCTGAAFKAELEAGRLQMLLPDGLKPVIGTIDGKTVTADYPSTPGMSGVPMLMHGNMICGLHKGRTDESKGSKALVSAIVTEGL